MKNPLTVNNEGKGESVELNSPVLRNLAEELGRLLGEHWRTMDNVEGARLPHRSFERPRRNRHRPR